MDKTPTNARQLIETMASNHQQFSTRSNSITLLKGTHGVEASYVADHKKLEGKLDDLAAMLRTLTDLQKNPIPSTLCGIFASTNHPTEACSMLKETGTLDNEQPLRHMLQTSMAIIDHLGSNTTMICPPTSTTQIGRNIPARNGEINSLNTNKSMFHLNRGNNHNQRQPLVIQTWRQW